MKKAILILFFFLLLFGYAQAFEPQLLDMNIVNIPNQAEPTIFSFDVNNGDTDAQNFDIIVSYDDNAFFSETFALGSLERKTVNIDVNLLQGLKTYDFNVYSINDSNIFNNTTSKDINVFKGADLEAGSISLSSYNVQAGTNISIIGVVKNSGDMSAVNNFNVKLYHETSLLHTSIVAGLGANQSAPILFDFNVPNGLTNGQDIIMVVDDANNVTEYNEHNNVSSTQFSVSSEPDLLIDSADLSFSSQMTINSSNVVTFKVKNIGGQSIGSVLVRAWHTQESDSYLVFSETASFSLGEVKDFQFDFIPVSLGVDKFVVFADPTDTLTESNENNNKIEKTFSVVAGEPQDANNYLTTKNLSIRKECFVLFSNNDKFISKGISKVSDDATDYCLSFEFDDEFGNELISNECAKADESFSLSGRTINILSVSDSYANALLVFSSPVTDLYSNCEVDVGSLSEQLVSCQENLGVKTSELSTCNSTKGGAETNSSTAQSALTTCMSEKSTCESNLSLHRDNCEAQVTTAVTARASELQGNINDKDLHIDSIEDAKAFSELFGFIGWLMFFSVVIAFAGFEYFLHYKRRA